MRTSAHSLVTQTTFTVGAHTHTHTYTQRHTGTHAHTDTDIDTHTDTHTHVQAGRRICRLSLLMESTLVEQVLLVLVLNQRMNVFVGRGGEKET